jgi:hypothetical protein
MAQNKRSDVWNFFEQKSANVVVCKLCSAQLVYGNSTGAMNNHVKAKHPSGTSAGKAKQGQRTMETFVSPLVRRCPPSRATEITDLLADMVTTDLLPLSCVDGAGFRRLFEFVEPGYQMPHRKAITTRIERRYKDCADKIKADLSEARAVAITTDGWTALTTESYITVTCHYIRQWRLESIVLQTRSVDERHTAINLAELLNSAVEEWGIKGKVVACVHDNASNITLANTPQFVDWQSCPCFAHTLQLSILDGMKTAKVDEIVPACNKLVAHFHHSTVSTKALGDKQRLMMVPTHRLIQSCKTRWNSVCAMFERLYEQRSAIAATLSDRSVTKLADDRKLSLPDSHWRLIEDILPVLKALKCATTVLSTDMNVSSSVIYPVIHGLQTKHLIACDGDCETVATFKAAVSASLTRRFLSDTTLFKKIPIVAAALDPRHKQLKFFSIPQKIATREHVKFLLEQQGATDHDSSAAAGDNDHPQTTTAEALDAVEDDHGYTKRARVSCPRATTNAMQLLLGDDYFENPSSLALESELESYLTEPSIPLNRDPLSWWKDNQHRYPRLSVLASKYMTVPATSVPSERVFSAAGLVVNRLRSRLSPEHVDMLLFLRKNDNKCDTYLHEDSGDDGEVDDISH